MTERTAARHETPTNDARLWMQSVWPVRAVVAALGLGLIALALRPNRALNLLDTLSRWLDPATRDPAKRLMKRVRQAIEPVVSNPGAITVQVFGDRVRLKGPILKAEVKAVLMAAHGLAEVRDVEDHLEIHETSEGVPGLQGRDEWHVGPPNVKPQS